MNKENYFITQFKSKYIGDDGAIIGKYIYSMDAFFEDIHFKQSWMSLSQIAQKSMLINISDAIVMNAKPKYALLSVAIPKYFTLKQIKQLSKGFKKIAKQYNIEIIGGDTISNDKLAISITIISKSNNPIKRDGAKVGDLICYTNSLGDVKQDLDRLLSGKKILKNSKFIKPILNPEFFYELSSYINSALDISDGLFFELKRLSEASKVGIKLLETIDTNIGCSGEEYEILFSFRKDNLKTIKKIAKRYNIKLNVVATATKYKKFKHNCKEHHFE